MVNTDTHTCIRRHACTHTYTHTRAHTHMRTHTHTHTHTHTIITVTDSTCAYICYLLLVTTRPNWIWLQDDLHEVLNLPRVLCAYLIPAIHCVSCGVPIMSLSYYATVNCSCSQRGTGLSPLLKAMEKWFTSLSHHVGHVLCGCDDRETSGLHHLAGSGGRGGLTECDILLKFQEKNLMLRFDFCSKRCGDAFIDSIFTITL